LPGLRQHQGVRAALEELRTDQFFQGDHVARQGALRDEQRVGRRSEAQVLGNAFEGSQGIQGQPTAIEAGFRHANSSG